MVASGGFRGGPSGIRSPPPSPCPRNFFHLQTYVGCFFVQNTLDCISEKFSQACARNSLEKCTVRIPDGRDIATVYTPLYPSIKPPVRPWWLRSDFQAIRFENSKILCSAEVVVSIQVDVGLSKKRQFLTISLPRCD